MSKKDITYNHFQKLIKDKDTAVRTFIETMLAKTQSMFHWDGLPVTVPQVEIERLLQETGNCFVTQVNGELYALTGGKGGTVDVYNRPTQYTVANAALNLSHTYDIDKDGVLIENDTNGNSLLPLIGKFSVLYTDGLISLNTASILTRITMLISASDDKTKASADEFLKKILDGEFSIIGENAFFKGVTMQTAPTTNSVYITQLVELVQYYRASLLNELGLNANYNMKRERLNLGEVTMNDDVLLPYVDNMLKCRRDAVDKINKMFGTEITVNLTSSWKLEHENFAAQVAQTDTVEHEEQEHETTPVTETEQTEQQEQTENVTDTETEHTEQAQEQNEQDDESK